MFLYQVKETLIFILILEFHSYGTAFVNIDHFNQFDDDLPGQSINVFVLEEMRDKRILG